ncbi:hypothetical protein SAMN02745857_02274 [Andreprevotia lacus DSM 23236]|uniref:Uncharacterized protein n=1 Tax=Andreprevotia lacus DSM 23236 TaxID=1121001 RepID=A0A1W1XPE2_9NEIS|nr:hypothetical protein [Andreprevotia lacus]SMC25766.1 hypothetical protein SAMN02745857_02274 [Andreprevotia lacus DSM 23236]
MARQRNVQQQNALTHAGIARCAAHWRAHPWPTALQQQAAQQGIDPQRAIIVWMKLDFPGMPRVWGCLLTEDGRFIDFELDTDPAHVTLRAVELWQDVTAEQNTNPHNRGFGAGEGALASQVLRRLNGVGAQDDLQG